MKSLDVNNSIVSKKLSTNERMNEKTKENNLFQYNQLDLFDYNHYIIKKLFAYTH